MGNETEELLSERELSEARDFAVEAAQAAGEITLRYFRTGVEVETKADNSPVTIADKESETLLRERIHGLYPEHAVIGEEFGEESGASRYRWIVDPIDGTKSFISGVPLYTVLIALCRDEEPLMGVIHSPATNETVAAVRGGGCSYNGTATAVRPCSSLTDALVLTTDFVDLARRAPHFADALNATEAKGRTWADGYGYLMVVSGRADAMIDPVVSPWDVAAVKPVLVEAGARCTDFDGSADGLGSSVIAAAPELHESLLTMARAG